MAKAAADHYVPGRFTTFAAFEWSSTPDGANLHRNVLFRDLTLPAQPFSSYESPDEKGLWLWIDEQQRQGRAKQPRLQQLRRLALEGAAFDTAGQARQRLQLRFHADHVECARGAFRSIVARRMVNARLQSIDARGNDRLCGGRWRLQRAKAVQHLNWIEDFGCQAGVGRRIGGLDTASGHTAAAAEGRNAPQHLHEQAGHGQVRPVGVGRHVEKDDLAFAAVGSSDERRSIFQSGPDLHVLGEARRVGENLAIDENIWRRRKACEKTALIERCERLRRRPGQGAAQRAAAQTQTHGNQVVAAFFQSRTGETHKHATLLDPGVDTFHQVARQRADVGHNEDGRLLLERLGDGCGEIGILRPHQLGERGQCLLDVVERREQRLSLFPAFARNEGHTMPARARIQEMYGARRPLATDLDARHLIAKLQREIEACHGAA
ncbi:MAG: DUF3604 domain-containing protein [Rhodospirillales bacterium]|nr:DUF3604 domain-containing protein [Rhodospirillales bacterium]